MPNSYTFTALPSANPATQRLLPQVLDEGARTHPDRVWAEIPVSPTSYEEGFRTISWRELANAVNGLAAALVSSKGMGWDFETLAYLGTMDPTVAAMTLAGIKAGYKVFLSSPRNSMAAHTNLFGKLHCKTIVTTTPPPPYLAPLLEALPDITVLSVPSLNELLATEYPPFPYNKIYSKALDDPIFCSHTSGSTGIPKPLVYTHQFVTRAVNVAQLQPPDGFELLQRRVSGKRGILFLPLFHIAGLYYGICSSIMNGDITVYPLANVPPTAASLCAILGKTTAEWALLAPMHIEEIVKDPTLLDLVAKKLKMIITGGGPLSQSIGNVLSSRVHLQSIIGMSELAGLPHLIPKDSTSNGDDWSYVHLHPYANPVFQDNRDGTSELILPKNLTYEQWQPSFTLFPELETLRTKDNYTAHPTKPNLWIHSGRQDDIVVFSNGEKTNPLAFEATVSENSSVSSALVFGYRRFEAGVLIERLSEKDPQVTAEDNSELLAKVFPSIDKANSVTPAHARVDRSHIIFTEPGKPFLRSGKGSIQRQLTLKQYEKAIDDLYRSLELTDSSGILKEPHNGGLSSSTIVSDTHATATAFEHTISMSLQQSTYLNMKTRDDNFFAAGLDSLQALRLARQLRTQLGVPIEPSVIYANPSVRSLARALNQMNKAPHIEPSLDPIHSVTESTVIKFSNYIEILASCIINTPEPPYNYGGKPRVVLLTGSTGFIGAQLLQTLHRDESVSHIFCLNRRAVSSISSPRVTELKARLSDPTYLGLPQEVYADIVSRVTLIIHAAWPVDFVQPLSRFELSLAETVHLTLLAARAPQKPSLLYLSSVGAVMNLKLTDTLVPSEVLTNTDVPVNGYGQSKHVAEQLIDQAARQYGVRVGIARLGQIAGPRTSKGKWNEREWFPRLIKSSKSLGCIPQSLGRFADALDWIPVDEAAMILSEIGVHLISARGDKSDAAGAEVFNIVNPRPGSWTSVLGPVCKALDVTPVGGTDWLERLRVAGGGLEEKSQAEADKILVQYPALILQPFYKDLFNDPRPLRMDLRSTERVSATMRNLSMVDDVAVVRWACDMLDIQRFWRTL